MAELWTTLTAVTTKVDSLSFSFLRSQLLSANSGTHRLSPLVSLWRLSPASHGRLWSSCSCRSSNHGPEVWMLAAAMRLNGNNKPTSANIKTQLPIVLGKTCTNGYLLSYYRQSCFVSLIFVINFSFRFCFLNMCNLTEFYTECKSESWVKKQITPVGGVWWRQT